MGTPEKRPYKDDYLLAYSREHVSYEFQMFLGLAAARDSATIGYSSKALATFVKNAVLEAVVLHVRNLLEFLYGDNPRPTDVIARDFFSAPSWEDVRPPISACLTHARRRADKEIAHLTTSRLDAAAEEREWDIPKLREELMPILRTFVDRAETKRLDTAVAKTLTLG